MYFSYFEKGRGNLNFQSVVHPFQLTFSALLPQLFLVALN